MFYTRCAELYARPGTQIGMVMPHSALRTGQHLRWRSGNYRPKGGRNAPNIGLNLRVHEPWDLDNVVPDFFPMPASVVFAQYIGVGQGAPLAPATVQVWHGDWQEDYAGISRKSEALHHDDGKFKSPYAELSSQGPTIVDRRLFFVETVPHTAMLPAANTTNVQPRLSKQDKMNYEGQLNQMEGVVSNDHLFDVYLGECIAPYVALDPQKAALPVHRTTMTMPLIHDDCEDDKHDACRLEVAALHSTMQRRWSNAVEMYREAHKNQAIKDLYSRLNHQNILTSQLEYLQNAIADNGKTVRVAYTIFKGNQQSAIIVRDKYAVNRRTKRLPDGMPNSEEEAHYVTCHPQQQPAGVPSQSHSVTTNWAKKIRDFHKHGWKLPIPRYDASDSLHFRLSELGATAEKECQALIANSDIMSKPAGDAQSREARRLLRHKWQPISATAQAIEGAVAELLSNPAQAALAKRQMEE